MEQSLKNKKIVYPVIVGLAAIVAIAIAYIYSKPADKDATGKQKPQTKPVKQAKPPKVKKFIQRVIVSAAIAREGEKPKPEEYKFFYADEPVPFTAFKTPEERNLYDSVDDPYNFGPNGIAVDNKENIYVIDSSFDPSGKIPDKIKKYDKNGKFISNISVADSVSRIAIDDNNYIYLNPGSVIKIDQKGNVLKNYKLSDQIDGYFDELTIVSNILYVSTYIEKNDTAHLVANLFDLRQDLAGGYITLKLGTSKESFSDTIQLKSIKNGVIGKDNVLYNWKITNQNYVVKSNNPDKAQTTIIKRQKQSFIRQDPEIDKFGNIYHFSFKNRNKILVRKYTDGFLVAAFELPEGSFYENKDKIIAVSDSGNIYYLYVEVTDRYSNGNLKIIECTLK
jgi:hypothetical protein